MTGREFEGQVAAVTGAAAGIGNAIARRLADQGARVCLIDIDADAVNAAASQIGADAVAITADVTDEHAVTAARDAVLHACGGVDVLVNNAGIYPHETLDEMTVASWDRVFDVNAKSVFLMTRAFGEPMRRAGYGRVVSIVTIDAYVAKPTMPHYAASKAAVASLVKTICQGVRARRRPGQRGEPRCGRHGAGQESGLAAQTHSGDPVEAGGGAGGYRRGCVVPRVRPQSVHCRRDGRRQRRLADAVTTAGRALPTSAKIWHD